LQWFELRFQIKYLGLTHFVEVVARKDKDIRHIKALDFDMTDIFLARA